MKKGILLFVFITALFSACLGYNPREIFTPLKENVKTDCTTPTVEVQLFFEGESINFQYEKIGLIEVQADYLGNETDQLNRLKALAKSKCCDAIIGVKKGYVTRETGLVFTNEPAKKFEAVSFSGVAVQKKN
jgi:hypothetical protein